MGSIYLQNLIAPIVAAALASLFFLLWTRQRSRGYILDWAVAYAAGMIGFSTDFFRIYDSTNVLTYAAILVLGLSPALTVRGFVRYSKGAAPDRLIFGVFGVGMVLCTLAIFVLNSPVIRAFVDNWDAALLAWIGFRETRSNKGDRIDTAIRVLLFLTALCFFFRPVALVPLEGVPDLQQLLRSFWLNSLKVMAIGLWTAMAMLFFLRIVNDLVDDARHQAMIDQLTGLPNRGGFFPVAQQLVDRHRADAIPEMCIAMCDIDRFKSVNDTHGHAKGDEVLVRFGALMRSHKRERDVIARLGGEEFAILMPGTPLEVGRLAMERLRFAFAATQFEAGGRAFGCTTSIGIADVGEGQSLDAALRRADEALYAAKAAGRNRVVVAGDDAPRAGMVA